ncbi:hypothetical protein [Sediminibacillus albus]|uniref:Uncharacterized protein n=1 Tax=Sediminibacillus albus TaxID=407036 RepID=A0A1G9B7K6_9BACI|nr:hypothetical protein [Sediminibacillus albus]SDK35479.1 hypothetical protein SAMN05216243_2857 [Sediminibacillus albus]
MSLDIIIKGIPLQAYKWKEEQLDQYTLTINTKINKEDYLKLTELRQDAGNKANYFDVMIADYVKIMRFGKIIYSDHGKFVKMRAALVEKDYSKELEDIHHPEKEDLLETVAHLKLTNDKLMNLLQSKGLLTEEELNEIKLSTVDEKSEAFELYRVEDVDFYKDETTSKPSVFNWH